MKARRLARLASLPVLLAPVAGCVPPDIASVAPGVFGPAAAAPLPQGVVARGGHADLREDDVNAFVEALEFCLRQVGYTAEITTQERQQVFDAVVEAFPRADRETQLVLAQARARWTAAQQAWPTASEDDRRAFVAAVFTLAYGEQPARGGQSAATPGGSAGGACTDIDSCVSSYADPGIVADTQNASSCWASAGCESYDGSTDSFTYEQPSYE